MLSHYFSIAIRHLTRNRVYSLITVFGLGIGLASVFLLAEFVKTEISYDRFHDGASDIYRIDWIDANPQTRTPHPMAQAMARDFPEVESAVSLTPIWGPGLIRQTFSIRNLEKDIRYDESNVLSVDSTFFSVFTFSLERGDPKTVLKNPEGILLSSSMAKKYFGNEDPMGKHLAVNDDRNITEVIGVFKDVPRNAHFHFDILVSYVREKSRNPGNEFYSWKDFGHYNYVRLKPGTDAHKLEASLLDWSTRYINFSGVDIEGMKRSGFGFRLQPLTSIHLYSHLHWELEPNGNISYVYMMAAAALLILVIGCINFINLTTSQSAERAKEIGIRKSLGAFRKQLSAQFIGESVLVALLAVIVSVLLIELAIPYYGSLTGNRITLNYLNFIPLLTGMGILVGILAGLYPAWYLSSIKPGLILKGKFLQSNEGLFFRKGFILFQFFASMVLISCSLIIFNQLEFVRHKGLGFSQDEVIVLPVKNRKEVNPRFEELQTELLKIPNVKSVSATSNVPGKTFNQNPIFSSTDPAIRVDASEATIDYDFFNTLHIETSEGRTFLKENPADRDAFVLNESAAKSLFPQGAIGKEISWERDSETLKGTVIGVVRDFHFQSLHEPVRPLMFRLEPLYNYILVKVNTGSFDHTIESIEKTWKKFDNRFGFEFAFLSDQLHQQYESEQNMAAVMITFAILAAVIACFGLLGIAALAFRQKIKEVSVRKVLGATLTNLTLLLLKDFTRLILIAIALAVPLVAWMMNEWLRNFAFRVTINPLVFVVSGLTLIVVAWGTLGYLTLKIITVNPAETLKSE